MRLRACLLCSLLTLGCTGERGECQGSEDCPQGQVCHARLGCVPRGDPDDEQDEPAEGGGDGAGPTDDPDPDRDDDEAGETADAGTGGGCDDLRARCADGDDSACEVVARECEGGGDADCAHGCGDLPEVSREHCEWQCAEGECVLAPLTDGALEEDCSGRDDAGLDEDCDGLANCDDPGCAEHELCRF